MTAPARRAAFMALGAIHRSRVDLSTALAQTRRTLLDPRDRALAADIVTGTLRWRALADYTIEAAASRRVERLDPDVLDILRLSVYQILKLDRVPPRAAISDAVDLTRQVRKRSAGGFVNAVLRAIAAGRAPAPPGEPPPDADRNAWLDYVSITLSQPRWLAARWIDRYGPRAAVAWARFNNTPAPIALRINRLKTTRERLTKALADAGVTVEPSRHSPDGLIVMGGQPLATPLVEQGFFVVQDESSQLVTGLVDARPGDRVLDTCAAPGIKTTALAAAMEDRGLVLAMDVRPRRVALLRGTIATSGARSIAVIQADATQPLPVRSNIFDAVLLDAPCSGLGTIRRDPDIKWRRSPDQLATFAATQQSMLTHVARTVRSGGRLVYATCSSEPEENEAVVAWFLDRHDEFTARGELRTLPHTHGLEAFFAVRLERR